VGGQHVSEIQRGEHHLGNVMTASLEPAGTAGVEVSDARSSLEAAGTAGVRLEEQQIE
jgi:hypothetical protein